jgi:2-polyprenyl-6-methoxyphenol hydroxylase-like FAD-dependent oxidoreductase
MLGYPVAGPGNDLRPGHRRYNIVWYRPTDEPALTRLLTDARGHRHDISIPPPLIPEATIAELRMAGAIVAPQFRAVLDFCDRPFLQPIYDFEVSRMHAGQVALIGDAAFVVRPHVGAGVAKAAQDAAALAQALATARTIEAALEAFEATRRTVGQRIVAHGRDLGAAMQAQLSTEHERAMAARYRDPAAVLADTATLDFL